MCIVLGALTARTAQASTGSNFPVSSCVLGRARRGAHDRFELFRLSSQTRMRIAVSVSALGALGLAPPPPTRAAARAASGSARAPQPH
eukprot:5557075-Prymnesium_polylepis.1